MFLPKMFQSALLNVQADDESADWPIMTYCGMGWNMLKLLTRSNKHLSLQGMISHFVFTKFNSFDYDDFLIWGIIVHALSLSFSGMHQP